MTFFLYLTFVLFMLVCVILVLLVLIQKGRGGGLSGAFGGGGGNTAFGSKTGDVLTWATSVVFGIFLLLAVAMNLLSNHLDAEAKGETGRSVAASNVPAGPAAPAAPGEPGGPGAPAQPGGPIIPGQ